MQRKPFYVKLLTVLLLLLTLPAGGKAETGPQLALSKTASPSTVAAGSRVTYIITLTNAGNGPAEGVIIRDTLPSGFTYLSGTSRITVNGVTVSTKDPTISGRTLTWAPTGLRLPSGRSTSFYGIHTFVQSRWNPCDHGYIDYQLDRAQELMGFGGYVTQLLDWIGTSWQGPLDCWKYFVSKAYDRGLTPVVRLAGASTPQYWIKPKPDPDGSYSSWARAFAKVVEGLPKRDGYYLYVQIWNEPNLNLEWEGQANPAEYGRFLVDTANAIRASGDPHVVILNAPLSPGGDYYYLDYLKAMLTSVPASLWAFDVWASHPYPGNRPPSYNIHDGTASDHWAAIDLYQRELEILAQYGRIGMKVLLTETGYELYNAYDVLYPPINEGNRADYMVRAFRDYWSKWPEIIGVCPYELVDPQGAWWKWDWIGHQQYDAVRAMDKSSAPVNSVMRLTFQVTAASSAGTYYNDIAVSASNAPALLLTRVAPVIVYVPTPTPTTTPIQTRTPTASPTASATSTPTWTSTPTSTPTVTESPTPSAILTPTETPTASMEPTATPSATLSATPGLTEAPTPAETQTPSPTPSTTMAEPPTITPTLSPVPSATATGTMTITPTPSPTVCFDLIQNGGFEQTGGWQIGSSAYPAAYTMVRAHTGQRSMRLGIDSGNNVYSWSTIAQQIVIPASASAVWLSCWYYPQSTDTSSDFGYISIYHEYLNVELQRLRNIRENTQEWTYYERSLDAFKGMTVRVLFGVYNDGLDGVTAIYLDDVAVHACGVSPTPTASPTTSPTLSPTPTPTHTATHTLSPTVTHTATPSPAFTAPPAVTLTPTPSPTVMPSPISSCRDLIINGGFEWDDDEAWYRPTTACRAEYTTIQAHSGKRSMRLGIESPGDNIYSYSTIRQTVHVPADAPEPVLTFWYYPVSSDTVRDLQYVRIESEAQAEWVLYIRSDAQTWIQKSYALDSFRGYDIRIYFGVVNDGGGGVTAMYVDDVALMTCGVQPTPSSRIFLPVILRTAEEGLLLNGYPGVAIITSDSQTIGGVSATGVIASQSQDGGPDILAWGSRVRTLWQADDPKIALDTIRGIALNPRNDLLYMAASEAMWVMEAQSGKVVARIPLPATPYGLTVDPNNYRVYAALQQADALAVIDGLHHRLLAMVSGIPGASGVAVGSDCVYVTAARSDELVVVNGQNYAIMKRVPVGAVPYAVLYDPGPQRVYVGNAGEDTVFILDAHNWTLVNAVKLGGLGHPHGLALDPIRDRLYVTYALSPKHRAIAVVDTLSGQVVSSVQGVRDETLSGAYGIAVDPLCGIVYVTTVDELLALTGEPLEIVQRIAGIGPAYAFGLVAAPLEGSVYLTDGRYGRLLVVQ